MRGNIKKTAICALCAAALCASAGCGRKKEAGAPPVKSAATNVKVYTAAAQTISNTVTYTGEIKAAETNVISAEVGAVVKNIYFEEGDFVAAGKLLVQLDDTNYKTACDTARASYNQAQATVDQQVESCRSGVSSAQSALSTAQSNYDREAKLYEQNSNVKLAQQNYNDAVAAYERQKELYDNSTALIGARDAVTKAENDYNKAVEMESAGGGAQMTVDLALYNLNTARATLETLESQNQAAMDAASSAVNAARINLETATTTARAALDNAENGLNSARTAYNNAVSALDNAQKAGAKSIEVAQNALKSAEQNLAKTKIYATSSGYAVQKGVTLGQMTGAGAQVCVIKNANSVDAEINVTEAVIPNVHIGTQAGVKVTAAGIDNIPGIVTAVNNVKNEQTGMYSVKVNIPNDNALISVGMFADITLTIQESVGNIVIPSKALVQEGEEFYVYIAVTDDNAEKRHVVTGLTDSDMTEITEGVAEGERIVTDGKDYLSETNTGIRITGEENEAAGAEDWRA